MCPTQHSFLPMKTLSLELHIISKTRTFFFKLRSIKFPFLAFPVALPRFEYRIFMNSRTTVASSVVSCKAGNKDDFIFWILVCLLSKFFKTRTLNVNDSLTKAIVRLP
ncbi:Uncharacterized protein Fot_02328 [Forsythia ovata]|uniref:Uncharacterized protein n=1 Tax=Forsythia ovata TaxID=205694 RepID=A0ABD1X6K1_9LAMI